MYASEMIPDLILRECPDRRARRRIVHREAVQVDGRLVMARDISANGVSVIMRTPVAVGDHVHVTLSDATGSQVATAARVVRVERFARRSVAGLAFVP